MKLNRFAAALGAAALVMSGSLWAAGAGSEGAAATDQGGMQQPGMGAGAAGAQMSSDDIRKIQQNLSQQGYDVNVSGQMDSDTQDALRQFQQAQGLPATGQPDQQTLSALGVDTGAAMGAPPSGQMQQDQQMQQDRMGAGAAGAGGIAMDAQTVRQVQQALNEQGYQIQVDGLYGPETRNALQQFQQAQGMPATGQLDQQTMSALGVEEGAVGAPPPSPGDTGVQPQDQMDSPSGGAGGTGGAMDSPSGGAGGMMDSPGGGAGGGY